MRVYALKVSTQVAFINAACTTVSCARAAFAIRVYVPKASTGPLEKRNHHSLEQLQLSSLQDNVKEIKLDIAAMDGRRARYICLFLRAPTPNTFAD